MTIEIIVPDRSIICPDDPIVGRSEMSGHFTIEKLKVDADGEVIEASRTKVAEFDNIVLDSGVNRIGTATDWMSACQLGTGTATPLATDTGLASFLGGTTSVQATVGGAQGSAPFFGWQRRTYRFAAGVATGNLTEVGVGWSAAAGANLYSRALILDAASQPTAITKAADEVLDVTYEARLHPPTVDATGNLTIVGSGTHDFVTRASNVTSGNEWSLADNAGGIFSGMPWVHQVYAGAIGAVTTMPSGAVGSASSAVNAAYANNSLQRAGSITFGLDNGNVGGIRSMLVRYGTGGRLGTFQTEFTPVINKTAATTLVINVLHTWGRRP